MGESPGEKGRRTRARLLAAAEEIFGRNGFRDASISAITRQAGVAQGSFYLYFESKQAAFAELIGTRAAELRSMAENGGNGKHDGIARERAALTAVLAWIRDHRWIYRVAREAEFVDPELRRSWYEGLVDTYAARFKSLMDQEVLPRTDPVHLAWMLVGMIELAALNWLVWSADNGDGELRLAVFAELALRTLGLS